MSRFTKFLAVLAIAASSTAAVSVSADATTLAGQDNGRRAMHRSTMRHHHHMMMKRQMMRSHRMQMDHSSRM